MWTVPTVQLCVRCRQRTAGFWVARRNSTVVRRPWCLACCSDLDRAHCVMTPFDGGHPRAGPAAAAEKPARGMADSGKTFGLTQP